MKILLSKESATIIALLMLLSLNAVAGITILVNAAAIKELTLFVSDGGSVDVTWKSKKSQSYSSTTAYVKKSGLDNVAIIPDHGYHIENVSINGIALECFDEDGFSLVNVKDINMISVDFLENGGVDDVDGGENVEAYPDPDVGLIFDYVGTEGDAYAYPFEHAQYPGQIGEIWDIWTTAEGYEYVTVYLVFNLTKLEDAGIDPYDLKLWVTEVDILRSDLNLDGMIDGTDVSIVANANPSKPDDPNWNETLDLYPDGVIDDKDVNIVNDYNGESVWEQLESDVWVDEANKLVYVSGVTDHFSIFGVH